MPRFDVAVGPAPHIKLSRSSREFSATEAPMAFDSHNAAYDYLVRAVMDDVDPQAADRQAHRFGQGLSPIAADDIAADCRHRRDVRQRVKMRGSTDIARVQNGVDAFDSLQLPGAQQNVGVGDDADALPGR